MANKYIREIDELGNQLPEPDSGREHLIPYVHMQEQRMTTSGAVIGKGGLKKENGNKYTYTRPTVRKQSRRKSSS